MLTLSPHLVWPVSFVYPIQRGAHPPGWQVDLGLWVYDRMTDRAPHRRLAPEELAQLAPGVLAEDLDRILIYGDAFTDDALLTLAVAGTGAGYGGLVLTRAMVEEGRRDAAGRLRGLQVRDLENGEVHAVKARLVVNATGAWVDTLRHRLGIDGRCVQPSRGSHLIFAHDRLPLETAVTIPSPDDRRPIFFIPHPEGVVAGTTDLFHEGDLDNPRPSRKEVAYILRAVRAAFPGRQIGESDIRGAFAGLRPIVAAPGVENPSVASREEALWEEDGLLSVAGGKLTTWRAMAEEVVDLALRRLPPERARLAAPCATVKTPVGSPAPADLPQRLGAAFAVTPETARALSRRLGGQAWKACEGADPAELRPLLDGTDLSTAEVRAHLHHGAVLRLEDLLLRRARFGMWNPAVARELVPRLEAVFREEFGWDGARWEVEVERAERAMEGWKPLG